VKIYAVNAGSNVVLYRSVSLKFSQKLLAVLDIHTTTVNIAPVINTWPSGGTENCIFVNASIAVYNNNPSVFSYHLLLSISRLLRHGQLTR